MMSELEYLEKQAKEFAKQFQWGLSRCSKMDIANYYNKNNQKVKALEYFFDVCFLDINGCTNMGTYNGKPPTREQINDNKYLKEFNPKLSFLAPAMVFECKELIDELKLSEEDAKSLFCRVAYERRPYEDMPFSPEMSWEKLIKKLSHK